MSTSTPAMSTVLLDAEIDEADTMIASSKSHRATRSEQNLNAIGDKVLAISGNQKIKIAQSVIASNDFSLVRDQVNNFVENSKILVSALDEIGKIHPFIQAAVALFKASIQLELTRRQNDEKVIALNITMCDMMAVLKLLKKVATPQEKASDGLTVEERVQRRMSGIIDSIKKCARLCDSYQRRHIAVKFLTSLKWQGKFTAVAAEFIGHQKALQFDLQIQISVEITNANVTLSALNENVTNMMKMIFDRLQSPEERELATFVESKGGVDVVLADDELLREVVKNQQKEEEKSTTKGIRPPDWRPLDLPGFRKELNKEVDTVLAENSKTFERRFEAVEISLREVKGTIVRESDRVIETILAGIGKGPHERVLDKDLYHIWKEMGWRSSVKATHFIMAIYDFVFAKSNTALDEIRAMVHEDNTTSPIENPKDAALTAEQASPAEDSWAMEFITVHRAQPLVEEIDEDGSSFITVNEANAFTASRPEGWSVLRWIAYWTVGFEMTTQWYCRRILRLFSLLSESAKAVLPANRGVVSQFIQCWSIHTTENLLAGLRDVDAWDDVDWDHHRTFLKFKDWILENERRMNEILRKLVYYIDQDNTLNTVTGGGRPEKYVMPLLYLLMRRSWSIMKQAQSVVLHPEELNVLNVSMFHVHMAVRNRVQRLQGIYKLQNIENQKKLRNVFFGLYSYVFEEPEKGEFWMQRLNRYRGLRDEPQKDLCISEPGLYYGPQMENMDLNASETTNMALGLLAENGIKEEVLNKTRITESLVGAWSGTFNYRNSRHSDGSVGFSIIQHTPDGRFQCSGIDVWGHFTLTGRVKGERITFLKEYVELLHGNKSSWRYIGVLNDDRDEMSGEWGYPSPDDDEEALLADGDSSSLQTELGEHGEVEETGNGENTDRNSADIALTINIEPPTPKEENPKVEKDGAWEVGSAAPSVISDATDTWQQGTFVMYRRPADYLLCRPPEEELQENKPRALWKLVRNVTRRWYQQRHLTWDSIRERRDKRQIYMELWAKRLEHMDGFENPSDEARWLELVNTVHPADLNLWRNIAQYKKNRETIHSAILCDHCAKSDLQSTRIICLQCSTNDLCNKMDLCSDCKGKSVYRKSDNKDHKPSHPMIQLRLATFRIEVDLIMSHAKSLLRTLPDGEPHHCTLCMELLEKPYWYCTQCEGHTFMCTECNDRFEKEKPWLLDRVGAPKHLHDWVHTMVLNTQAEEETESDVSTNERLDKLEAKLDKQVEENRAFEASIRAFETSVTARLQKLEELLERLVFAVTRVI